MLLCVHRCPLPVRFLHGFVQASIYAVELVEDERAFYQMSVILDPGYVWSWRTVSRGRREEGTLFFLKIPLPRVTWKPPVLEQWKTYPNHFSVAEPHRSSPPLGKVLPLRKMGRQDRLRRNEALLFGEIAQPLSMYTALTEDLVRLEHPHEVAHTCSPSWHPLLASTGT